MGESSRILYCRCAYAQVVPGEVKDEVLDKLADSAVAFDAVPDLCEMSARKDPQLRTLANRPGLKIVACYPRAVKCLFAAADAPLPDEGVQILNMRTESAGAVVDAILGDGDPARENG